MHSAMEPQQQQPYIWIMRHGIACFQLNFVLPIFGAAQVVDALEIKLFFNANISHEIHLKAAEAYAEAAALPDAYSSCLP